MGEVKEGMSTLRWSYLSTYNWVLFGGWVQVLYLAVNALVVGGHKSVYAAVEKPLQIWQTAALLEGSISILGNLELNSAILKGLNSICAAPNFHLTAGEFEDLQQHGRYCEIPVSATLPQISSRIYVTWGILYSYPETRDHWLVTSLILSWGITEVIRYSFFGLKEAFSYTPQLLLWIRYSTFFILYPIGICSEAGLIYVALAYIKVSDMYTLRMPNRLNFAFDYYYASLLALSAYVPGSPYMYAYMIGQRQKALGRISKVKCQ